MDSDLSKIMKKFKYTWLIKGVDSITEISPDPNILSGKEELGIELTKKGHEGWELVSVLKLGDKSFSSNGEIAFFFKKEEEQ